jgi:REP element-mobilizing transposase RayT
MCSLHGINTYHEAKKITGGCKLRRQKSVFHETYHIVNRGFGGINIFRNDKDKDKYLDLLAKGAEKYSVDIIAYCLMDNHYHLCVSSRNEEYADISSFLRYANSQYVRYFNKTSEPDEEGDPRAGSLFGTPYKAVPVNDEFQLEALIAYIHNNPAPMGVDVKEYKYSSYHRYLNVASGRKTAEEENEKGLVLKFSLIKNYTEDELIELTKKSSKYKFCEGKESYIGKNYITDELLTDEIEYYYEMSISEINKLKGEEKSEILYAISKMPGVSKKQIARVFSIDYHYLCRILRVYAQKVSKRATPIPAGLKEAFVKDTTKKDNRTSVTIIHGMLGHKSGSKRSP